MWHGLLKGIISPHHSHSHCVAWTLKDIISPYHSHSHCVAWTLKGIISSHHSHDLIMTKEGLREELKEEP